MTTYTAKAEVEVSGFQVYPDSSGAPAVVRVADFAYAADFICGEVSLTCIKSPNAGRTAAKVAASRARRIYMALVQESTSVAWREANIALYSEKGDV